MLDGINRPVSVPGFHLSHPLSPHHGHSHCLPVICSCIIPFRSSLMVLAAGGDIERAVDLLEHHNAREMMRERHGRHRQPQRRPLLDALGQTARAADEQAYFACPRDCQARKIVRELLGGHRFSLDAHRYDGRARPDPALDERSLAVERLRDLALGGRLRQPLLGQLDDL